MVRCTKCKAEKAREAFSRNAKRKTGLQAWCKDCCHAATRSKPSHIECRDCSIPIEQDLGRSGRKILCEPCRRAAILANSRRQNLRASEKKFGITRQDVVTRGSLDGCSICGTREPQGHGFVVDHDHACCPGHKSCGACIRGILCGRCNSGIGLLGDSVDTLNKAAAYLIEWNERRKAA